MKLATIAIAIALGVAGCAGHPQNRGAQGGYGATYGNYAMRGTVERIELIQGQGGESSGLGAVGGAVAGGLLGNQVGKGKGKTLATIAGVAAGAYAGNEAEKAYAAPKASYRISVRMSDGQTATFSQPEIYQLRTGDRIRIDQNRVVPDY